jgi:hypothetical protein
MVTFKTSARVARLTPALVHIFQAVVSADGAFAEDMVITSVNDSRHAPGSAHYRDVAVDLRCNDRVRATDEALCDFLEMALGPKFLVLYEGAGTPNEHIHIQLRKGQTWP